MRCKKDYETCLGKCGGTELSMPQDFVTTTTKAELSEFVLGERFDHASANCSVKTHVFEVPLFEGAF